MLQQSDYEYRHNHAPLFQSFNVSRQLEQYNKPDLHKVDNFRRVDNRVTSLTIDWRFSLGGKLQTHKRFKITLFTGDKIQRADFRIVVLIRGILIKTTHKQQLNGENDEK